MRPVLTNEQFIEKAQLIHNNKYDYSQTIYTLSKHNVDIICPNHGTFRQVANHHISGNGCPKCGSARGGNRTATISTAEFIRKSRQLYLDDFDYHTTDYINNKTNVKIICKRHGEFKQRPDNHLSGLGCKVCNKTNRLDKKWYRLNRKQTG